MLRDPYVPYVITRMYPMSYAVGIPYIYGTPTALGAGSGCNDHLTASAIGVPSVGAHLDDWETVDETITGAAEAGGGGATNRAPIEPQPEAMALTHPSFNRIQNERPGSPGFSTASTKMNVDLMPGSPSANRLFHFTGLLRVTTKYM